MFTKSLPDLIRILRANRSSALIISIAIREARIELSGNDMDTKSNAILKLAYLFMLGYTALSEVEFSVIEVMSSKKFRHKRIGYLAAALSFNHDSQMMLLCTNLIRKDLVSGDVSEVGLALSGLSNIITVDLAQTLILDVGSLVGHSRPSVRKKALLVLFRMLDFLPEHIDCYAPRIAERLYDTNKSVAAAAVNVLCELTRIAPKHTIRAAPHLFQVLNSNFDGALNSNTNWVLIKIIKSLGLLCKEETRLAKKIAPIVLRILDSTHAISVQCECLLSLITIGKEVLDPSHMSNFWPDKICGYLESADQNLKFIGLSLLTQGYRQKTFRDFDAEKCSFENGLMELISHSSDPFIRTGAINLLVEMAGSPDINLVLGVNFSHHSKAKSQNLYSIVDAIMIQVSITKKKSEHMYKKYAISKILEICLGQTEDTSDITWLTGVTKILLFQAFEIPEIWDGLNRLVVQISTQRNHDKNYFVKSLISFLNEAVAERRLFIETPACLGVFWAISEYGDSCEALAVFSDILKLLSRQPRLKNATVLSTTLNCIIKTFVKWTISETSQVDFDNSAEKFKDFICRSADIQKALLITLNQTRDIESKERAAVGIAILEVAKSFASRESLDTWVSSLTRLFHSKLCESRNGSVNSDCSHTKRPQPISLSGKRTPRLIHFA